MAKVTVVGGGLSGMLTALRLLELDAGIEVEIYEGSNRLGGKAGANLIEVDGKRVRADHGYHIFPTWYANAWQLIDQLGIRDNYIPFNDTYAINKGDWPHMIKTKSPTSLGAVIYDIFNGTMPPLEMFLFMYLNLDLMSQKIPYDNELDEFSVNGFLHSRFYATEDMAEVFRTTLLQTISTPPFLLSAKTLQMATLFFSAHPDPSVSVLNTSLQEGFIDPIAKRLEELGCQVYFNHTLKTVVTDGNKATQLGFEAAEGDTITVDVDRVVMAIPPLDLATVLDDNLNIYDVAPALYDTKYLGAQPMAALNIYCNTVIPNLPEQHVLLSGSKYGLTFIDVSQVWNDLQGGNTVLNVIASDYTPLEYLSDEQATRSILDDLRDYVPVLSDDVIEQTYLQPHTAQPLFMNYTGSWEHRPDSGKPDGLSNLFLAGTYCRTQANLATMEGAIESGNICANAVRENLGISGEIPVPQITYFPRWLILIMKVLMFPFVIIAWILVEIFHR